MKHHQRATVASDLTEVHWVAVLIWQRELREGLTDGGALWEIRSVGVTEIGSLVLRR